MSISLSSLITAYDALGTLVATTKAKKAIIVALGARPTFPANVTADSQYNTPLASIATYDAAMLTANADYVTAVNAQKVQENACLALMVQDQWLTVTGLANWGAASTQYIGIKNSKASNADNVSGATLYYIITNASAPTFPFPNV